MNQDILIIETWYHDYFGMPAIKFMTQNGSVIINTDYPYGNIRHEHRRLYSVCVLGGELVDTQTISVIRAINTAYELTRDLQEGIYKGGIYQ